MVADHARLGSPGGAAPACARGCSWCCHQRVDVTAPEVFALAAHVRAELEAPAIEKLRERLETTRRALDGLDAREHHLRRIPCALLGDDGACSVYSARPFACRRGHSTDADACRAAYEQPAAEGARIPDNPALSWNTAALVLGYREGYEHAGRPLDTYELNAALATALSDPTAEPRWFAGEDPLAAARTHDAAAIRDLLSP